MANQLTDAGIGFRYTAQQAAAFREKGWWGDEILLDRLDRWTSEAPDRELVTDGAARLTYGQAERILLAAGHRWPPCDERPAILPGDADYGHGRGK